MTEPVEQRVTVRLPPDGAFELFTRGLASWWPFRGHSCGDEDAVDVHFEPCVGGLVTEIGRSGACHPWGALTEWDPPHGFAMQWHPAQPADRATLLRVRFAADGAGTQVHVWHGGWEVRGDAAQDVRDSYDQGWPAVLERFRQAAERAVETEEKR